MIVREIHYAQKGLKQVKSFQQVSSNRISTIGIKE